MQHAAVPRLADTGFIRVVHRPPDTPTILERRESVPMKNRIARWLERAGSSLGGATALTPIDASYGASFWGRVPEVDERRSMSAGRLPLVAAAHLPVF